MREFFIHIFNDYGRIIVFLHIISACLLIGSMFVMRFVIQPVEVDIEDEKVKFGSCLKMMKRYILFLVPVMLIIVLTSIFMNLGLGFKNGNPATYVMVHTKEALWTFITFNFVYMYFKYLQAKKGFDVENYIEVEENMVLMVRYLIPLNLILAMISVYFGVILRGY
ncbi:MAG: hypothetical protein PHN18_12020 [Sulfurospirillaceae bacterium]|jgi:uncharacterized membrane protein|nr:hypothetical protein [Sulfurospirillaceae bacterium]MDD2827663.1 hypothetical protein [Sulfurospirillaceae bacterium]